MNSAENSNNLYNSERHVTGENQNQKRNRTEGHIINCDGKIAIVSAISTPDSDASDDYWGVGQLISIAVGASRIVGLVYKLELPDTSWQAGQNNLINIHIELIGEIKDNEEGNPVFKSGISNYPYLGAVAHRIRSNDLAAIYENSDSNTVSIGSITQDSSIPAIISVDSLLSRHFAVVGTTGVGKSTSVALILRKIVKQRPDIRTLILDPHNEFATAFPDESVTVDASSLDLPYWMFTLEEFVEVIYRGRPGIGEEVDALRDLIPEAKAIYEKGAENDRTASLKKRGAEGSSYTADTPVPYRMVDLFKLIDDRLGLLEGKADRPHLKSLKNRIELVMNDPRFSFMFNSQHGAEAMNRLLALAFRIPQNDKPICVFELSGLPSEVVNVVASVMCRLAFELGTSSHGTIQTLVVCEEAHRYIPADTNAGFLPTRLAIARIAKEGRKYGVYLAVITQRPGELDPTILSQCNTVFSMRLGNEHDQAIVRKAITGAANSTVSFLSSLANRECIAFGEAMEAPMRMTFETVKAKKLPGSSIYENQAKLREGKAVISLSSVIMKMREMGAGGAKTIQSDDIDFMPRREAQPVGEQPMSSDEFQKEAEIIHQMISSPPPMHSAPVSQTNGLRQSHSANPPAKPANSEYSPMSGLQNRVRPASIPAESVLRKTRSELDRPKNSSSSGLIRAFRPK